MILTVIGALLFLSPNTAIPACPLISVPEFQDASPNIRVTVYFNSRPLPGAKIDLYSGGSMLSSIRADAKGQAALPRLSVGSYQLSASTSRGLYFALYLKVNSRHEKKTEEFAMNVAPGIFSQRIRDELAAAEDLPVVAVSQRFSGIIRDANGKPVPKAKISVWRKGNREEMSVADLISGDDGGFSTDVPDGEYLTLVQADLHLDRILVLKVEKDDSSTEFEVQMPPGVYIEVC